jgi:hypothetical protein
MLKMLNQHYIWQAMIGTSVYEILESSPCLTKGIGLRLLEIDNMTSKVHETRKGKVLRAELVTQKSPIRGDFLLLPEVPSLCFSR